MNLEECQGNYVLLRLVFERVTFYFRQIGAGLLGRTERNGL